MDRREFLNIGLIAPIIVGRRHASERWRTFEVTTRVELQGAPGAGRVWLPVPASAARPYHKDVRITWSGSTKGRHDRTLKASR
jgi:hypothetical protein